MIPSQRNEAAQIIGGEPVAIFDVHEIHHDQNGLGRRDHHRGGEVIIAQRHIGRTDGREQQHHERAENDDVGLDRGNVLLHWCTSIR